MGDDEKPTTRNDQEPARELPPDQERIAMRAAVEAGYASLADYIAKYGEDSAPGGK